MCAYQVAENHIGNPVSKQARLVSGESAGREK